MSLNVSVVDKIPKDKHCEMMAFLKEKSYFAYDKIKKHCYLGNFGQNNEAKDSTEILLEEIQINPSKQFQYKRNYEKITPILMPNLTKSFRIRNYDDCFIVCHLVKNCYGLIGKIFDRKSGSRSLKSVNCC